jgi:thiol:disulfide interchange protein DsbD
VLAALATPHPAPAAPPVVRGEWRVLAPPAGEPHGAELALDVVVDPGWHVNAHDPDRPYLIPTELEIAAPPGTSVAAIRYPDAVVRTLAFAGGSPLRLYEGHFTITVVLAGDALDGVTGRLRYQACNDERCLPPQTLPVTLAGRARPRGGGGADRVTAAAPRAPARFETWMRERGPVATLAIAALFGLALNHTPCVYPHISVTIAYFGGQSVNASGKVALLASVYVLGIAITFSALGVAAALSGGLFGSALQQPVVLLAVAVVLVVLAASNFGLYQFRVPSAVMQRAGKASTGVAGALVMGLTMGVVAAPCVGPIVVALLLFVAARQDAALGFALFFALALGMGAPYIGLAIAAGSIRRLPRSGEWLRWVEHLFGFVLLGMALYFLAPVLGGGAIDVALPILIAIAGLYLGFLDSAGRTLAAFVPVRRVAGIAALIGAVWVAIPRAEGAIEWRPFSPPALAAAAAAGRPSAVDFTAAWCLPCRENDRITFRDPQVAAEAERFAMLRADVTETNDETERWMGGLEIVGVPTIVLFDGHGTETGRSVGFVEPARLLALMREAR